MPEHAQYRTPHRTDSHPRRVSGPVAPAAARPGPPRAAAPAPFERLRAHPRPPRRRPPAAQSRGCIWLIGIMLGGIVAMQVSLLRLNTGISRAVQTQSTLEQPERDPAGPDRRAHVGRAHPRGRGRRADGRPARGQTRYLTPARPPSPPARSGADKPPSDARDAVMANGGMLPGALAEPGSAAARLAAR